MRTPRVRRPRLTYANVVATFALVLASSMGGAYAHGMIGSADIKQNAVKSKHIAGGAVKSADLGRGAVATGKIKGAAVTRGKLAGSARTNIVAYTTEGHDFSSDATAVFSIPGVTPAQVANSAWSVQLRDDGGNWYLVNGPGVAGASTYRVGIGDTGAVNVFLTSGVGEEYTAIRVFRSERTVIGATGLPVN